jgi:hypothetical protein
MDSRNTSPYSPAQRKVLWISVSAAVLLAAATSFPFRQRASNAAQPASATLEVEIPDNAPRSLAEESLVQQQRSIIEDMAIIVPLAQKIPPSVVLARLINALPAGVSLSEVTLDNRGSAACLSFAAVAHSETQAGAIVEALRSEPLFPNVRLISDGSSAAENWGANVQIPLKPTGNSSPLMAAKSPAAPPPLADLDTQTARVQRDITMLESVLPAASSVEPLQKQIVQLAAANSLQLTATKSLPGHELSGCIEQSLEISLSGSFNGFYSFLLQLESLPRLKTVTKLQMRDSDEHNGDMQATITVDVFSKLPPG